MTVSKSTRARLHERAHSCCERCGKAGATNAHHRINQSQGGPDTLSNLLLLCGSGTTGCHGWVTANPQEAQQLGMSVTGHAIHQRQDSSAADRPVLRWSRELGEREWVLLDDDGGITQQLPEVEPWARR